ncbi:porin family protein [bacterium]|nr:porin family protein [bacterium]
MKKILLTAVMLGLSSGAAHAQLFGDTSLYVGVDTVDLDVDTFSSQTDMDPQTPQNQRNEFESSIIRLRLGWNVNENFGLEIQYGLSDDDTDFANNTVEVSDYIGIFAVPTADLADYLKLEIPLGYAITTVDGQSEDVESESYGVNFRFLPAKLLGSDFPLSLSAGYLIYGSKNDTRVKGTNLGLRLDF